MNTLMRITEKELKNFAEECAKRLLCFPEAGNVICLFGEMGTGKTTFARFLAEFLGVSTVSSPTFSIVEKHFLENGKTLFHADFHRISAERAMDILEELPLENTTNAENAENYHNFFLLEWLPEKCEKEFFSDIPLIKIFLEHGENPSFRLMKMEMHNPKRLSVCAAKKMLEEWKTPVHVQKHIENVRKVAVFCAEKLKNQNIPVDTEMVEVSAILHDCVRYVDFPTFSEEDLKRYEEEVSLEKLEFWKSTKERFKTVHHADAMAEILREKKFFAEAKVVAFHKTGAIYQKNIPSWEEICVYYADKRCLHDTIVSLENRLLDGKKRYAHEKNPQLEEKIFALEHKLCSAGKFLPEEIVEKFL